MVAGCSSASCMCELYCVRLEHRSYERRDLGFDVWHAQSVLSRVPGLVGTWCAGWKSRAWSLSLFIDEVVWVL